MMLMKDSELTGKINGLLRIPATVGFNILYLMCVFGVALLIEWAIRSNVGNATSPVIRVIVPLVAFGYILTDVWLFYGAKRYSVGLILTLVVYKPFAGLYHLCIKPKRGKVPTPSEWPREAYARVRYLLFLLRILAAKLEPFFIKAD